MRFNQPTPKYVWHFQKKKSKFLNSCRLNVISSTDVTTAYIKTVVKNNSVNQLNQSIAAN